MKNKIQIAIPQPCTENWNAMTASEKGKFCASCQKDIVDFTTYTDREILNYYNQNSKICGKFTATQLNRNLIIPKEKKSIWMMIAATFIAFLGLNNQTSKAQESAKTEQTDQKQNSNSKIIEPKEESIYSGIIYDENKIPLPGVNVTIKGTTTSAVTNIDGAFSIKAKKREVLVISYIGYITTEYKLKKSPKVIIQLKAYTDLLGEVVIIRED